MVWFRRKEADQSEKYVFVFKTVHTLLQLEHVLIAGTGNFRFENTSGSVNGPALGYVYGFADAAMIHAGLKVDTDYGKMWLVSLYNLYSEPQRKGEYYFQYMAHNLERKDVMAAVQVGGNQYLRWANSKGSQRPWGWGKYFGMGRGPSPPSMGAK